MNSEITTLDPVTTPSNLKTILSQGGFSCSILTLAPGDETPLRAAREVEEHILFVLAGEVTIRFGDMNTMLSQGGALLIPQGKEHLVSAGQSGWAKVLRVDVPPRQVIVPQIISPGK